MLRGVLCEDPNLEVPTQVPWEGCLACAHTWGNPCSLPYPLMHALYEDSQTPHSFPSVTSLTGCLRKAWLMRTRDYYEYPSGRIALIFGTWVHDLLEASADGAQPEIKVQYTTEGGVTVSGTADLYVPATKTLMDWKTAKQIYLKRVPYDHHETQVNLYAFMLQRNELEPQVPVENLRMVYISKSGPDNKNGTHNGVVQMPVVMWDEDRARTFIEKRAWALDQAMKGELVPRKTKVKWNCSYCPVVQQCEAIRE